MAEPGINYPAVIDNDDTLLEAVNNIYAWLAQTITATATTILLKCNNAIQAARFPSSGYITIHTIQSNGLDEAVHYESRTVAGSNVTLNTCTRGSDSTFNSIAGTGYAHNINTKVSMNFNAKYHNQLKDAIIAIENNVGASGGTYENLLTKVNNVSSRAIGQFYNVSVLHGNVSSDGMYYVDVDYSAQGDIEYPQVTFWEDVGGGVAQRQDMLGVIYTPATPGGVTLVLDDRYTGRVRILE